MKKRSFIHSGIIVLAALLLGFFDLPSDIQKQVVPFAPDSLTSGHIHLGLDLQGGSQLDYKVDLRNVPETDQKQIIDGILNVINKRVNSLGVAEPNIYTSDIGDEKHLIVELAGVKDLEEAKATVGKTIQLEFKEQKTAEEQEDPNLDAQVQQEATDFLNRIIEGGEDIRVIGQEEALAEPSKISFFEAPEFVFYDQLTENFRGPLFDLEEGQTLERLVDSRGAMTINEAGEFVEGPAGYHIVHVTEKQEQERQIDTPRQVYVSHILFAYAGAERAEESVTRSEEEAKTLAEETLVQINEGGDFKEIATELTDDLGTKEFGGKLGSAVEEDGGLYVKEFEDAALAFTEAGQIADIVESPFGFHIIKADDIEEAVSEVRTENQIKFINVHYSAAPDPWKETNLDGQHFVRADVEFTHTGQPYVSILFDDEGGKIFEELTRRNLNQPIAIFVGGEIISAPNVNDVISGGQATITGQFSVDEAKDLARDLNTGAIPAPITLAGQYSIGASLGQESLSKSLDAGIIGILLVALFMILLYRLPGLLSVLALGIYAVLLIFVIKVEMPMIWALIVSTVLFSFLVSRILKNKESGSEKTISAILVAFILFFLTFVLSTPIVMTLAGIAGVILSIGMAVDANILIFERVKEELKGGRAINSAIEVGFERAWPSIRDSNFSSLITCGILFYFGSSIIQGFAFNLAAGILISMITAITITKSFMVTAANSKLGEKLGLFNKPKTDGKKEIQIIQKRKKLYWFSAVILVITLVGLPIFGLKLGLDFTGGTLMELKFQQEMSAEKLREGLVASGEKVMGTAPANASESEDASSSADPSIEAGADSIDFSKAQIVTSENGFIIKTPHISADTHDALIAELKTELGEFEETRFSTVGPTVGSSLQQRAVFAIALAVVMIILYIAFAFRRVPRSIGKWRFGLTAIAALIHDLGIMIGVYVYLGVVVGVEIDALFITAMLTVLGFSVHDTIVVFDRIREKLKFQKRDETFDQVCNQALNDTLARSINTSISTLVVLLMLAIFGGESIRYFVIALIVGIISGTYSSIFVATPLLVDWVTKRRRR